MLIYILQGRVFSFMSLCEIPSSMVWNSAQRSLYSWLLPEEAFFVALELLQLSVSFFLFQGGGTLQAARGVPTSPEMVTSGLTQNIDFTHVSQNSCQFSGRSWMNFLSVCLERTFPFLFPTRSVHTSFEGNFCYVEPNIWKHLKRKFWLVKENFLLHKLLEMMLIWGCHCWIWRHWKQ